MRKCDPITDKILDLIDERMLVASPTDRIQCKDLCLKLASFLEDAHRASKRPEISITQDVMTTLLEFDRKAPSTATEAKEVKAGQGLRDDQDVDLRHEELRKSLAIPNEPMRQKSKRFSKPERQGIVKGKIAHRTSALETALGSIRESSDKLPPRDSDNSREREDRRTMHESRIDGPPPMAPSPTPSALYDNPQPPGSIYEPLIRLSADVEQLLGSSSADNTTRQHHKSAQLDVEGEQGTDILSSTPPNVILTEEPKEMTPRIPDEPEYHTGPGPGSASQGPLHIQQPSATSTHSATPRTTLTHLPVGGSPSRPTTPVVAPNSCPPFSPYRHMHHSDEAICKERVRLDQVKKEAGFFRKPKKDAALKDLINARDFVSALMRMQLVMRCRLIC
jgi:hypothetical protein